MEPKLKKCSGCDQLKHIWKKHNRNLYCKDCWYKHPESRKTPLERRKETCWFRIIVARLIGTN